MSNLYQQHQTRQRSPVHQPCSPKHNSFVHSTINHASNRRSGGGATTKCNLVTLIRAMYWSMFGMLVFVTFLRQSVLVTTDHQSNSHYNITNSISVSKGLDPLSVHSNFHYRMRGTNKATSGSFGKSQIRNSNQLPGMHNPRLEIFEKDSKFYGGGQNQNQEKTSIKADGTFGTKTTNNNDKIDWWSVFNRVDRMDEVKKYTEIQLKPKSAFVKHLHRLKDEIMAVANWTTIDASIRNDTYATRNFTSFRLHQLAKTPSDQPIDFLEPILQPPARILQNKNIRTTSNIANVVVLVLSHQGSFIKRQAIRETWAKNHSYNVLFVVAQSECIEFEHDFSDDSDDEIQKVDVDEPEKVPEGNNTTTKGRSISCEEVDHNFLRLEQERYQDLLEIPMKEQYNRLPEKLLQAYHWVLRSVPDVEWIIKSDDDMYVRINSLERYLRKYNPNIPMVIGEIIYHSRVAREGKWREDDYDHSYYPYWPKGSAGHVCSRAAIKYFSDMSESLHRYQGEDTSIGIWLDEARKNNVLNDVTYIHAKSMFESQGKDSCEQQQYMMIGHDLSPDELLECNNQTLKKLYEEVAWLDAPSNFQEMIREDVSSSLNDNFWSEFYDGENGDKGGTSIGYNGRDPYSKDNNYGGKSGSSYGYRAHLPFSDVMQ